MKGLVDQHHGDIADHRIDASALDAFEALLDHRLFASELVPILVAHLGAPLLGKRHGLDFFFADGTSQDFEQFGIYRHAS